MVILICIYISTYYRFSAILYVIASGRMGQDERDSMEEIIEALRDKYTGCRKKLLLIVSKSPAKLTKNNEKASDWVSAESTKPNSPFNYFVNMKNVQFPNRVLFVNNKNPKDYEDAGKLFCQIIVQTADDCTHFNTSDEAKKSNEDFAALLRVKINELRGPDAKTRPWTKIDLKKRGMRLPKYGLSCTSRQIE